MEIQEMQVLDGEQRRNGQEDPEVVGVLAAHVQLDIELEPLEKAQKIEDFEEVRLGAGLAQVVEDEVGNVLLGLDFGVHFEEALEELLHAAEGLEEEHGLAAAGALLELGVEEEAVAGAERADEDEAEVAVVGLGPAGALLGEVGEDVVELLEVEVEGLAVDLEQLLVGGLGGLHVVEVLFELLAVPVGEEAHVEEELCG